MKVKVAQSCLIPCDPIQSMGFSWQEYWNGLHFPSPGNFPNPGIEPGSPTLQADSLPAELQGKPSKFKVIRTRWPSGQGDGVLIHCALHGWVRTLSSFTCGFHALPSAWARQVVVVVFNEEKKKTKQKPFLPMQEMRFPSRRSSGGGHGNPL